MGRPLLRRKTSISAVLRYGSAVSCVVSRPFRPTTHSLLNHHCVNPACGNGDGSPPSACACGCWSCSVVSSFPLDGVIGTTFDDHLQMSLEQDDNSAAPNDASLVSRTRHLLRCGLRWRMGQMMDSTEAAKAHIWFGI